MNNLIALMKKKELTVKAVAEILKVKENTVRVWRSNPLRCIPNDKFRLLKIIIGENND